MDNINKKCSNKEHENLNAIYYCNECKIYLCNKCDKWHSQLFQNHNLNKLDKNSEFIFNDLCKEYEHNTRLEFFCKNHNKLVCGLCITKIKKEGKGQHSDCDLCEIENIKEEKNKKLKNNIQILENLYNNYNSEHIEQMKILYEKINIYKEELKLNVQKVFTKIRNTLNNREDELLLEINKIFNEEYINEKIIKECINLKNKINIMLEKGKIIDKNWNDDKKLISLINECINIENETNEIKIINENKINIEIYNDFNLIKFYPQEENKINEFINSLANFGKLEKEKFLNIFKDSIIINNNKIYIENILKWINSKNTIKAKLLYRKSRDGDSYEKFHNLCDNQGPTLILIKSIEQFIIGAYTPLNWDNTSKWKKDDETFLFSLTNNKKYNKTEKSKNSIYCGYLQGPWFPFIGFSSKDTHNMSKCRFEPQSKYFEDYLEIIPNKGVERTFDVEEVEVYKISLD